MSGTPTITYCINLDYGTDDFAYAVNTKFPDQRIDLSLETIQDLKVIYGLDPVEEARNILKAEYYKKYLQD